MSRFRYYPIIAALTCLVIASSANALEYTSYIYNTYNLVFFSYEDDTTIEIYEADGSVVLDDWNQQVLINNGNPMSAGEHFELTSTFYIKWEHVYKVTGSKRFAVLSGDATTYGISGYYAMDANGSGTARHFHSYVPQNDSGLDQQKFLIFAYQPDTNVTVYDDANSFNQTFNRDAGGHWSTTDLNDKYVHVTADKPVSALSCYDHGYFVPASTDEHTQNKNMPIDGFFA